MKVRAQFFAQLRDLLGVSEKEVELSEGATVGDLIVALYQENPALRDWDKTILFGSGVEFVDRQHVLQANDDIAIMPPVQGG